MLSYAIAMPATISTAIVNIAYSTSTTIEEFTENTSNIVTASAQQQQQAITTSREGGAKNN
jgi:hypothetical protein